MGLCTPINLIYEWLADVDMDHLLRSSAVNRIDLSQLAAPPK